jgi:hypothetical protein
LEACGSQRGETLGLLLEAAAGRYRCRQNARVSNRETLEGLLIDLLLPVEFERMRFAVMPAPALIRVYP